MARFGRYNITMNRKAKPLNVIFQVVVAIITLFVGQKIINSIWMSNAQHIGTCFVTDTTGMFYQTWSFMGIVNSCASAANGILGVIGIIIFAILVLNFVRVNKM